MNAKRDKALNWWIRLANFYGAELQAAPDSNSPSNGFADKVRELEGPRAEGVDILLNPTNPIHDRLIGFGNDPDRCLWNLAGVANSVLSSLSGVRMGAAKEMVIADWSEFAAPLILSVSDAGEIIKAYRPEPLASGLMTLLKGRNAKLVGKCSVCGRLFQRLRRDQKCDSERCRDTLRQRRHRARVRRRQVKGHRDLKSRARAER